MLANYQNVNNLKISKKLLSFVNDELLKDTYINPKEFWLGFDKAVHELAPKNKELIKTRDNLQNQIDDWHIKNKGTEIKIEEYKNFLKKIGYLKDEGSDFKIETKNVDDEIAKIAGPQLVVPIMNARYALNAANARWVSLYDSLYGTNIIQSEEGGSERYDPNRGQEVIKYVREFFDKYIPIEGTSWKNITGLKVIKKELIIFKDDYEYKLKDQNKFIGYRGDASKPEAIILKNNNLHFEIIINPRAFSAAHDIAGISDVIAESAVSTICDNEDSVAAVDAEDKVACYRNWLGLMKGDLKESFDKNGSLTTRELDPDRTYITSEGNDLVLPGRSLMLIRNVGHLMTNPGVLDSQGNEVPEGIIDAMFTICIAMHDLNKNGLYQNSKTGSIYIVKPKMHGPEEVQFTCDLFSAVEEALGLPQLTVKVGIMDEERRTTVNLKECIEVAKERVIFINTGFLDRTGDEIHTSMEAGPMITKADMKLHQWIAQYENWNVDIGLETGFKGRAQIGKGMWPMPDEMLGMYNTKTMHPKAGANCAWVPSPTAATLHAIHYHQILVSEEQETIMNREKASLDAILDIPVHKSPSEISPEEIQAELENNCQGILGYVVRWVDQGVGCSKVPDINNVGLMEDRATCRISSQHIANWLHHNLVSEDQVRDAMKKMALVVDDQNDSDPLYKSMAPSYDGLAFEAACNLAIQGRVQPSGYTEPILHETRLKFKS